MKDLMKYQAIPDDCPKCGMDGDIGINVIYEKDKQLEYLKCKCICGYWWTMKTKDGK